MEKVVLLIIFGTKKSHLRHMDFLGRLYFKFLFRVANNSQTGLPKMAIGGVKTLQTTVAKSFSFLDYLTMPGTSYAPDVFLKTFTDDREMLRVACYYLFILFPIFTP